MARSKAQTKTPAWPIQMTAGNVQAGELDYKTHTRRLAEGPGGKPNRLCARTPGDLLYVQEPIDWGRPDRGDRPRFVAGGFRGVSAFVDQTFRPEDWTPRAQRGRSRDMPKWAHRACLEIQETRFEAVDAISEDDARAEGIVSLARHPRCGPIYAHYGDWTSTPDGFSVPADLMAFDPVSAFAKLWDRLHPDPGARFEDGPRVIVVAHRWREGRFWELLDLDPAGIFKTKGKAA